MKTEIGEYAVGAYLKLIECCDVVDYNVRPPGGGLEGLGELDVIGLQFHSKTAYLCEVTTHITGLVYGSNYEETLQKLKDKHARQLVYANQHLAEFPNRRFMFWSPVVPEGKLTELLATLNGLELIINQEYTRRIQELKELAKSATHDAGNPFFRTLQILQHLKPGPAA